MGMSDTLALIQVIAALFSIALDIIIAVVGFKINGRNKQMNDRSQSDHVASISQFATQQPLEAGFSADTKTSKKIECAFKKIRNNCLNNEIPAKDFINNLNKIFSERTIVQTLISIKPCVDWHGALSVETIIEIKNWDKLIATFLKCPTM